MSSEKAISRVGMSDSKPRARTMEVRATWAKCRYAGDRAVAGFKQHMALIRTFAVRKLQRPASANGQALACSASCWILHGL